MDSQPCIVHITRQCFSQHLLDNQQTSRNEADVKTRSQASISRLFNIILFYTRVKPGNKVAHSNRELYVQGGLGVIQNGGLACSNFDVTELIHEV